MSEAFEKFGEIYRTAYGVERVDLQQESLQVVPDPDGGATVSVVVTNMPSRLFRLDPAACRHFAAMLLRAPGVERRERSPKENR